MSVLAVNAGIGELPLVEEMPSSLDVFDSLRALRQVWPSTLLVALESTLFHPELGRYSYVTCDPFWIYEQPEAEYGLQPFVELRKKLQQYHADTLPDLPPFQGGLVGLLGYELGRCWERVPVAKWDEFRLPVLHAGLFDWTLAWDHAAQRCWLISHGFPAHSASQRRKRAAQRLAQVKACLQKAVEHQYSSAFKRTKDTNTQAAFSVCRSNQQLGGHCERFRPGPETLKPVTAIDGLFSDFSQDEYVRMVERVIQYIYAGDIFQANVSQRLLFRWWSSPLELYRRLRKANPAPFAGLYWSSDWAVVSASPERFLQVTQGWVETRPIKGTAARADSAEADVAARASLMQSQKDVAENLMIVDLLRNDLSRVCRPGTVRVAELCRLETYETVHHLVSVVKGQLRAEHDLWDLLRACFPGGSVTGAPKIRAMEIIAELEPTVRGPYCGSLFWAGLNGNLDSNILIRTFVQKSNWVQCSVGGGVVAQSAPQAEYNETLHKAAGMLRSVFHDREFKY